MDNIVTEESLIMEPLAPEGTRYLMQCQEKAWAGDIHLAEEILRLRDKHGLDAVIETGTYIGTTTLWLAKHFKEVITAEVMAECHAIAKSRLAHLPHVHAYLGAGKDVLADIERDYLIFLDAHPMDGTGKGYDVVIQELEAIAKSGTKPSVIAMHDFQVPDHPDFQFDRFDGKPFTLDWVGPSLDAIYGVGGWDSHYNSEATGVRVGVLFVERA